MTKTERNLLLAAAGVAVLVFLLKGLGWGKGLGFGPGSGLDGAAPLWPIGDWLATGDRCVLRIDEEGITVNGKLYGTVDEANNAVRAARCLEAEVKVIGSAIYGVSRAMLDALTDRGIRTLVSYPGGAMGR